MRSRLATSELGGEARAAVSPLILGYWDGRADRQADPDVIHGGWKRGSGWAETGLDGGAAA